MEKDEFLFPKYPYQGEITSNNPEYLLFNANLQEFGQRVGYICNLETGGKISPEAAYKQIKVLWKGLKQSKKQLGIQEPPSPQQEK